MYVFRTTASPRSSIQNHQDQRRYLHQLCSNRQRIPTLGLCIIFNFQSCRDIITIRCYNTIFFNISSLFNYYFFSSLFKAPIRFPLPSFFVFSFFKLLIMIFQNYIHITQNFLFLLSISKRSVRVALEDHSGAESMRAQGPSYGADINFRTRGSQPFLRNHIALYLELIIIVTFTNALYLHIVNASMRTIIYAYITVLQLVVFYFDYPFLFSHSLNQFHFFCFTAHIFFQFICAIFLSPFPNPPIFHSPKSPVHIRYGRPQSVLQ